MFFHYVWKRKWLALLFTVLAFVSSVCMAGLNLAVPSMFDSAQAGKYMLVIEQFAWLFAGLIGTRLLEYYADLSGIHAVNVIRRDIKQDLFAAVIGRRIPDHAERDTGEYIAEFTNDITIIENKFLLSLKDIVASMITIVTVDAALFIIDYRMAIVIAAGTALCLGLPILMTKFTSLRMIKFLMRFDRFVQRLKDLFGAFFTFKNYAVEKNVVKEFEKKNEEVEKLKWDAEASLIIMNNLVGRLAWLIEILVLVIGLFSVIYGDLSIGSVFAAYILAGSIGRPLQGLGNRISMIRSLTSLEKKFKSVGMLEKRIEADESAAGETDNADVVIDNVSLTLKDKEILKDVSLTFEQGKKYLILGSNGSGKSTTAKLLKNSYYSYTGTVTIGGHDIRTPEGAGMTRRVSYSNETVALISDSVRNNILLYRDVPEERLENALKMSELNVPLDRTVGDGGRFLSSGERRKLEIARALIEDPKVMILDEVVSTLDIETAYEIEKLVLSFDDRTVVMVSNAFSGQLLDRYDQIILMSGGRIVARGSHAEMLKECEEYRRIYDIRCASARKEGSAC